jgi:hypothetical protein
MSRARMPSQAGDKAAIRRLCVPSCHMWRLYCHILMATFVDTSSNNCRHIHRAVASRRSYK